MKHNRIELIKYHIEESLSLLDEAEDSMKKGRYNSSLNRASHFWKESVGYLEKKLEINFKKDLSSDS